jgi:hypothetical protein
MWHVWWWYHSTMLSALDDDEKCWRWEKKRINGETKRRCAWAPAWGWWRPGVGTCPPAGGESHPGSRTCASLIHLLNVETQYVERLNVERRSVEKPNFKLMNVKRLKKLIWRQYVPGKRGVFPRISNPHDFTADPEKGASHTCTNIDPCYKRMSNWPTKGDPTYV